MKLRHGDVILGLINILPKDATLVKDRQWLFLGEATGHSHKVDIVDSIFETKDGVLYLKVDNLTKVSHEEHKTVTLKPGVYRVTQKRQYTPEGWERVAD